MPRKNQAADAAEPTFDERLDALTEEMRSLLDAAQGSDRAMTDEEAERFDAIEAEIAQIEADRDAFMAAARREKLVAEREAQRASRQADAPARVTNEPEVYNGRHDGHSYFADLFNGTVRSDFAARERLERNNRQVADQQQSDRALSTVNGAAGEFVPPLWLVNEFIKVARPGRPTADALPHQDVPAGTDSINVPRISTGTQVALQGTQNTALQQTDLTTNSVSATVFTVGGGQTVSLQLIEQSPINVDRVVLPDLAADYARVMDNLVVNGTGTGGQPTGFASLAIPSGNQITFTSGTPTAALLYSKVMGAVAAINAARYAPPNLIIMHPRRWAWLAAQVDGQNRPLIVPRGMAMNAAAVWSNGLAPEGFVGFLADLPVLVDPAVATNVGAGTNQDTIFLTRTDDQILFEGGLRTGVFQEIFANQLSWYFRVYSYAALMLSRYPGSTAAINGTGLVAPTF